jgi:hypothetical protein
MATYRYATKDLSIAAAQAFLRSITFGANDPGAAVYYVTLGNVNPYPDEPTPINPEDNDEYLKYDVHREIYGAKKVNPSDASHVTTRYDWISGIVYSQYRDIDEDMYERNFYVLTNEYNVYKCLYNNKNSASTVKPTGFSTLPFTTSDGYTWKYMYTISLGEANKFLTAAHMPIKTIVTGDGSVESDRQLNVQNAAVNGSIEIVEVTDPGSNYSYVANGVVSSANTLTLTLQESNEISSLNGHYVGDSVYIISGTGAGQLRRITKYVGASKKMTVNTAFATLANSDSRVIISPSIVIVGDGAGAKSYAKVSANTGEISDITVIDRGAGYTRAHAHISSNATVGFGASANVVVSPPGGHGSNPINELYGDKIMINVQFNGKEGVSANGNGYIPSNTEFRSVNVLRNPKLKVDANNNTIPTEVTANTSNSPNTLRMAHRAKISYLQMDGDDPVNPLNVRDSITNERVRLLSETGKMQFVTELNPVARRNASMSNAINAANASIVYIRNDETETDPSFYTVYLNNVDSYDSHAAFVKDDIILVEGSETKVATIEEIKGPEANTFSGEIVFTENVQAVVRDVEQTEDIKIIIDF